MLKYFLISTNKIIFLQIVSQNCVVLDDAVLRSKAALNHLYQISQRELKNRERWSREKDIKFMFRRYRTEKVAREENRKHYQGTIQGLNLNLTQPCDDYPKLGMNENCTCLLFYSYLFILCIYTHTNLPGIILFVRYSRSLGNS